MRGHTRTHTHTHANTHAHTVLAAFLSVCNSWVQLKLYASVKACGHTVLLSTSPKYVCVCRRLCAWVCTCVCVFSSLSSPCLDVLVKMYPVPQPPRRQYWCKSLRTESTHISTSVCFLFSFLHFTYLLL